MTRRRGAEVALELAGDRVAARLGQVGGVLLLLERAHVLGDLGVLGGQLVDAALPGPGLLGQLAERRSARRAGPRAAAAAPASPSGTAAARRSAAPRPRATPPGCRAGADASWSTPTMPVGPSYATARGRSARRAPGRPRAGDRHRPGVRDVGQQRAEDHDRRRHRVVATSRAARCRRCASACRLDAADQHDVACRRGRRRDARTGWSAS